MLQALTLALGGALTIGGAALLVVAFRHGQRGDTAQERRVFRLAVASLAAGSALFLVTVAVTEAS